MPAHSGCAKRASDAASFHNELPNWGTPNVHAGATVISEVKPDGTPPGAKPVAARRS